MNKQVTEIMNWFNFNKVARVMEATDWTWAGHDGVPLEGELREFALEFMAKAISLGDQRGEKVSVATGGFHVDYDPKSKDIELSFKVDSWLAYDDSEKKDVESDQKELDFGETGDKTGGLVH